MIQLNLLPDVKGKYIKAERLKRLVFGASLLTVIAAVAITGILASVVYGAQKVRLSSLDKSIKTNSKTINETKDLDKILTVQNQLNSITKLHEDKPVVTRLFEYLPKITPNDVSISNFSIKFDGDTVQGATITGSTKSIESINRFVDTLKFTKYTVDGSTEQKNAFSDVVLNSFSRDKSSSSYAISLNYDPGLFDSQNKNVVLVVPNQVTTQSTTQRPDALFQQTEGQAQ